MITVICPSKFEPLMTTLDAKIIDGRWSLASLSNDHKELLESESATIEGCKYRCWNIWFPNIYRVTRDPRCSASFNTLAKRAAGLIVLDAVVVGRAKVVHSINRKGSGCGYRVQYQSENYPSEAALARAFGVNPIKFRSRRQLGWSIKEALDESV